MPSLKGALWTAAVVVAVLVVVKTTGFESHLDLSKLLGSKAA